MSKRHERLPPAKPLPDRAKEAMGVWFKTLSRSDRAKLAFQGSRWGRQGGTIIAPKRRPTRAYRKREELRREREVRSRAEYAAYESRRVLPPPIKNRNES